MHAFMYDAYGKPEVLDYRELETPEPNDNQVRIKVHATSINSWDWDLLRGEPFIVRLAGGGIAKPKIKIIGCDVSGVVDAVGKNVARFKKGDAVTGDLSGDHWGCLATYVCANENAVVKKPPSVSDEQAASLPQAGVMALQGVHHYGKLQPGQSVLINGAGGGVGSIAIQLAKLSGAEVTAVDHCAKREWMIQLGADHVIDYTREDCTQSEKRYDLILDIVGHHGLFEYRRILKPTGNYRMIGGPIGLILQSIFVAPLVSSISKKKMGILVHEPNKELETLLEYAASGKIKPVIDQVFPFEKTREAFTYFGTGMVKGKVVISIDNE